MSVKFKESTQWYKFFLRSNRHSNGCLPYENMTKQAKGTIGCKMLQLVEPPQFCIIMLFCFGGVSQIISYYLPQDNVSY